MATHGSLSEYIPSTTSWRSYVDQLNYYFVVNDITTDKKQVAILLSACGPATFKTIESVVDAETLKDIKYADLVKTLSEHYDPVPSSIVQRYKFYNRSREEGESIADFVASLREIAKYCDYNDTLNMMLRDRLVCGVNHQGIQKRLLSEKDLSYEKALEIALLIEAAEKDVKHFMKPTATVMYQKKAGNRYPSEQTSTHKVPTGNPQCHRCLGYNHPPQSCPFKLAECNKCHKKGHIARACKTKQDFRKAEPGKRTRKAHYVEDAHEPNDHFMQTNDSTYNLFTIGGSGQDPIVVEVIMNNSPIQMELDTGASLSLLCKRTYEKIPGLQLQPTDVQLKTYTGEVVQVLGEAKATVSYGKQTQQLVVYVVNGNGPNLMGRDWLSSLKVSIGDINRLGVPNKLSEILSKHESVFNEGLGTFTGGKVTLHVDPQVKPKFFKARTLPISLKDKVEEELHRLEHLGIITPIKHSQWAAPVVPVLKHNGSIRLCGDYRVTINQASKVDTYSLPRVEDLFAAMSGGKVFSKLDMSQAYLQLPLDDKSKELVTINTHKGLFKYNRLPFGVSSAPVVFQRCMESLFQGCKGVAIYLDDILVTGPTVEEHLANLDKVLGIMATAGLKLNKTKCEFLLPKVEYLGHLIDGNGLHPTKEKVNAIQEAPQPHNVTELRSFLGIINYYGKFLPNLSTKLAPLYQLLKRGVKWL